MPPLRPVLALVQALRDALVAGRKTYPTPVPSRTSGEFARKLGLARARPCTFLLVAIIQPQSLPSSGAL